MNLYLHVLEAESDSRSPIHSLDGVRDLRHVVPPPHHLHHPHRLATIGLQQVRRVFVITESRKTLFYINPQLGMWRCQIWRFRRIGEFDSCGRNERQHFRLWPGCLILVIRVWTETMLADKGNLEHAMTISETRNLRLCSRRFGVIIWVTMGHILL